MSILRTLLPTTTAIAICLGSQALASDARSIALGGAIIANGKGVHGALSNPAAMMAMQRRGESSHFRFGSSVELRDTGNAVDILRDSNNDNLITDIESDIDAISGQPITCNPIFDSNDTVCVSGTQPLSDLAGRVLDIINTVDGESIDGLATGDLGFAYTRSKFPVAVNLRISAAGSGTPDISDGDRTYISTFNSVLDENLTLGELEDLITDTENPVLEINLSGNAGQPLTVTLPETVLASEATGGAVVRTQLGISLATTVAIGGVPLDVGITPKFSSLSARSINVLASEEFEDNPASLEDRFEASEVTESSFTVDIGASMQIPDKPLIAAFVIRNLIPESISTEEGFEFDTTSQLIVGAAFQRNKLSLTGDIALNEASQDGFDTQKMGVGVEFGTQMLAVRAGISHDAARKVDPTSISLGLGLGGLDIGGRLTDLDSAEVGVQLAFSFN